MFHQIDWIWINHRDVMATANKFGVDVRRAEIHINTYYYYWLPKKKKK